MTQEFPIAITVDARGTRCPVPLLRAKQALKTMRQGEYLLVRSTDPSAQADFEAMLRHLPHELVKSEKHEGESVEDEFTILKG